MNAYIYISGEKKNRYIKGLNKINPKTGLTTTSVITKNIAIVYFVNVFSMIFFWLKSL